MSHSHLDEHQEETVNSESLSQNSADFEIALKEISGDDDIYADFDAGPRRDIGPREETFS